MEGYTAHYEPVREQKKDSDATAIMEYFETIDREDEIMSAIAVAMSVFCLLFFIMWALILPPSRTPMDVFATEVGAIFPQIFVE